jgi:hypothetical protein
LTVPVRIPILPKQAPGIRRTDPRDPEAFNNLVSNLELLAEMPVTTDNRHVV